MAVLPEFRSARLVLRDLVEDDAPALFRFMSDPAVMRYWSRPALTELHEAEELLAGIMDDNAAGRLLEWGVALPEGGLVGTLTLHHLSQTHRRAEIGFALAREQWGRGLMREAAERVVAHAFATSSAGGMELERLEADTDPRNTASIGLLERLGFQREGLLRRRWCVGGEWSDSAFFGLLREEWEIGALGSNPHHSRRKPGHPPGRGKEPPG